MTSSKSSKFSETPQPSSISVAHSLAIASGPPMPMKISSVKRCQIDSSCSSSGWRLRLRTAASRAASVAARVEGDAVARGDARIAVGGELGPGAAEREVDVEEDCAQTSSRVLQQPADRLEMRRQVASLSNAHAIVWPIVQPRARSRSSPSSDVSRVEAMQRRRASTVPELVGRARSARPRTRARRGAASGR